MHATYSGRALINFCAIHVQATEMARYMVTQCGFNDVVGPMYFADEAGKGLSEETRRKVGLNLSALIS